MSVDGREQWCNLRHVGHTAHVPLTDVLVEGRCAAPHIPVRRHTTDGGREGGHTVRSRYTAAVRVWVRTGHRGGTGLAVRSCIGVYVVTVIEALYR